MPPLAAFLSGNLLFFSFRYFPFVSGIVFFCGAAWSIRQRRTLPVLAALAGFLLAFWLAPLQEAASPTTNRALSVKGRFISHQATAGRSLRPFVVEEAQDEEGREIDALQDETIWTEMRDDVDPDAVYELAVQTGSDRSRLNPGGQGRAPVYAEISGIERQSPAPMSLQRFFDRQRRTLADYIAKRFDADTADFIGAVTIGGRIRSTELRQAFATSGLAHILSISGTHFGLLSVVVFGCLVFFVRRLPNRVLQRITLFLSPSQAAAVLCLPLMVLYLGISGGSVPALRSFVMITLFLAGLLLGRKGSWLNTILVAAALLVVASPDVMLSLSFQLSFIAVLCIGYALEHSEGDDAEATRAAGPAGYLKTSLRISLAATLGTAPLVAYHFHYASLISPAANLLAAPLIGFVVIPLALLSSFSYLLTGIYLFAPVVKVTTGLSLWMVRAMASVPHADVAIPSFPPVLLLLFYGILLLFIVSGRRKALLGAAVVPFLLYAAAVLASPRQLSATFLDVGQGDSAVVELPDGRTMVIDTGRTGFETEAYLKFRGKRRIDLLVITHPHPDHAGGREHLVQRFDVVQSWDNGMPSQAAAGPLQAAGRSAERGDVVKSRSYSLQVFHPYAEFMTRDDDEYSGGNNASIVLKVSGRAHAFLFAGDVEEEAEDDLVHLASRLKSDVLKVPHHGGRTSADERFLTAVSPSLAVISVGRGNTFGHPSSEMLDALAGVQVLRTDRDGAVKVAETPKGLEVTTAEDYALRVTGSMQGEWENVKRLFRVW